MAIKVVIIGAGPAGLLLAHYLLARSNHYHVFIYDRRSAPRNHRSEDRAFVISLTERGQHILKAIDGLWPAVRQKGVEVRATGIYSKKLGQWQSFQRSKDSEQFSLLINRNNLCLALLEELEKRAYRHLQIVFNAPCVEVDLKAHRVKLALSDGRYLEQSYDLLVGADGVHSAVRNALLKQPGFDFQQSYFNSVWKVLHIPKPVELSSNTSYFFRHKFPAKHPGERPNRLSGAAIPEVDGQLCILMFWGQPPHLMAGNPPGIQTPEDFQKMVFEQWLPGIQLSDAAAQEFFEQRPSSILETRCNRYHDTCGQVVLVGDAAHAMSSFLAQGCQAAFADVVVLAQLLQAGADDLRIVLPKYSELQVKEGHAITDLNTQLNPQAEWLSFVFNGAMALQGQLSQRFPHWVSPTFFTLLAKTTMPYVAIARRFRPWMSLIRWSNQRRLAKTQPE